MKFPIVLKTEPAAAPPGQLYYEVAANGVFQVRDTPLYRAVTRNYDAVPGLVPGVEELMIKFPRLPRADVEDVLAFFAEVYRGCEGEAVVVLFYCASRREYRVVAPPQTIPGRWQHGRWRADYSVRYENVPRPDGFVRFGTIHSHSDLAAYSSGLDCDDERYEDGLHIVFGDFHRLRLSVAAAFVAGGVRFRVAPGDVLDDWRVPARSARPDWVSQVRREDRTAKRDVPSGATLAPVATQPKRAADRWAPDGSDAAGRPESATIATATSAADAAPSADAATALAPQSPSSATWQETVDGIVQAALQPDDAPAAGSGGGPGGDVTGTGVAGAGARGDMPGRNGRKSR